MIVTDRADWAEKARYLTTQAKDDPVEYIHGHIGYNYRLTNVQAAIGCAQMESLDAYVEAKRNIAATYRKELAGVPGMAIFPDAPWAFSNAWMATVLVTAAEYGLDSRHLMQALSKQGIQTRPLWQPLHRSPAHRGAQALGGSVSEELQMNALSLPCSVGLTLEQQKMVVNRLLESRVSERTV
jgi:dTDP-4-amino-4,6-dideoxygalactose transaminase